MSNITTDHTAPELLEAVGVDWRAQYGRESQPSYEIGGDNTAYFAASNEIKYTGPALGTPELDALLLVAGQRWLRDEFAKPGNLEFVVMSKIDRTSCNGWMALLVHDTPGHALARAIREVNHA